MKLYGTGDAWPTPDPPADRVLTLPLVEYQARTRTSEEEEERLRGRATGIETTRFVMWPAGSDA